MRQVIFVSLFSALAACSSSPSGQDGGAGGGSAGGSAGGGSGGGSGGGMGEDAGLRPLPTGTSLINMVGPGQCGPMTAVPTSRCFRVAVACPGIAPADVLLKVSDPTVPVRGTIVFGTGSGGNAFYESFGAPAINGILLPLLNQGYRIVQRNWAQAPYGWLTGPGGTLRLACRYSTLLERIHTTIHTGGGFCATGNSGGSAEISYGLAHYGMGRLLDLAVPTAGPPMARIDYGCLGTAVAGWGAQCAALATCPVNASCEYTGPPQELLDATHDGGTDCRTRNPALEATWRAESVMSEGAELSYPQTTVRFVYGTADCTEAAPIGRLYASAITSDAGIVIVQGAPHPTPTHDGGAAAIFQFLSNECVQRH